MTRRDLIALLGSTAATWPLGAGAQQPERMRRIFVLVGIADDAEARARAEALHAGLQVLGWTVDRNVQLDYRFAAGDAERIAQTNPALQAVIDAAPSQPVIFL
jgi:putative ABC transport system substrate-binding protein